MSVVVDLQFLSRIIRIRYGTNIGTAVCVQVGGGSFIVTAAHVVAGLAPGDSIAIRYHDNWNLQIVEGFRNCPLGSDVCAMRLQSSIGEGLAEDRLDASIQQGQEVSYCGFPLGLEMVDLPQREGWPTAFIKGAILSGFLPKAGHNEFLFDTLNNSGFSGGPIIKRAGDNSLKVVGIVSGYRFDAPIPVLQREADGNLAATADYCVRPNSGFMIGISITRAVAAANAI